MYQALLLFAALAVSDLPPAKEVSGNPVWDIPYVYSYASAYKTCLRTGKPLFVWVGQPAQTIPYIDALNVEVDSFDEAKSPCVVVARSVGGRVLRIADLNGTPDARTFHRVLHPEWQQRPQPRIAAPSAGC